jgi:hypothetical protein
MPARFTCIGINPNLQELASTPARFTCLGIDPNL